MTEQSASLNLLGPVQAPLVKALVHKNDPEADYRLVTQRIKSWEDYWVLTEFDPQTISLLATALRKKATAPALQSIVGSSPFDPHPITDARVASRRTAEYTALLLTVPDVLAEDIHLNFIGPNDASYADAFSELFTVVPGTPNYLSDPLPMDSDGDINGYSALIRYMLSVKYPLGVRTIQYSSGKTPKPQRVFNPDWISLISRRNKPEETAAIVAYYDERGVNPTGAEQYLNEHAVSSIGSGWL